MANKFATLAFTNSAKDVQSLMGSRKTYARMESGPEVHGSLTENEGLFLFERDSFYISSVSETGWPYVQHRGGPKGFLKVLSPTEIGFADFAGNKQYISVGNLHKDSRVALILVDYPNQARLKILGRARIAELETDSEILEKLTIPDYKAKVERGFIITVDAYDWNCPQHITPRWTAEEIEEAVSPLRNRIKELEEALAKNTAR